MWKDLTEEWKTAFGEAWEAFRAGNIPIAAAEKLYSKKALYTLPVCPFIQKYFRIATQNPAVRQKKSARPKKPLFGLKYLAGCVIIRFGSLFLFIITMALK